LKNKLADIFFLGSTQEIIILTASFIAIFISLIWAIYTIKNRKDERIIASSPLFMLLILLGSVLLYSSCFAWFPRSKIIFSPHSDFLIQFFFSVVTKATCILRIWLLDIGFTLLFGALFAKSISLYDITLFSHFSSGWRIYHIFYDKTLRVIKISNLEVLKIITLFLSTQIVTFLSFFFFFNTSTDHLNCHVCGCRL